VDVEDLRQPRTAGTDPVPTGQVAPGELFRYFLALGWLAFGGPVGQIGLMHLQLVLFILPGFISLSALGWIYVHYGKRPEVLGVLWGFRPVGLALLLAALVRISRAALKGALPVALAVAAFVGFYFLRLPFLAVLLGCGLAFFALRRAGPGPRAAATAAALLLGVRTEAVETAASRALDLSWFFLKVGLFSFGGAYAVLPYIREGAVATYGWITDRQMIDALALGETTPGPLISIGIFVGFLAGQGVKAPWLGASLSTFWLFLPSFLFVLPAARYMNWLTSRPGLKEFLRGVTSGVVGLMFSISIPLARIAFMPSGTVDWVTVLLGLAAFATLTFWEWRLNVVAVAGSSGSCARSPPRCSAAPSSEARPEDP
jgi:chromate transporter